MKKIIIPLAALSACLALTGCTEEKSQSEPPKTTHKATQKTKAVDYDSDFRSRLNVGIYITFQDVNSRIVTDPKTGVEYIELYMNHDKAGGISITPRLNKDGKPYINPKWEKKRD